MTDVYARTIRVEVYTGTNAAGFLAAVQQMYPSASTMADNSPTSMTIRTDTPDNGGSTFTAYPGGGWDSATGMQYLSPEALNDGTAYVPLAGFLADRVEFAGGYAAIPNLAAGASATVTVPLKPQLPSASGFHVTAVLSGSLGLLGSAEIQGTPSVVSASAATVVVKNTGVLALGLGGTVMVHCVKN